MKIMPEEKGDCLVCGYNKKYLIATILMLIVAGAFFYAGAMYEKNKLGRFGILKNDNDVCFVPVNKKTETLTGEILIIGKYKIVVKNSDGSVTEVLISPETNVGKKNETLDNFAVGNKVVVRGFRDAEGKILAHSIRMEGDASQSAPAK